MKQATATAPRYLATPAASRALPLTALSLSMLMPSLDTSIANAGLPVLARAFGASFPAVQWVVLAYLLAITTLIVSAGRLGDIFGRRRLLLAGIALFTIASLLCGLAPTLWLLIAARAAQGLGAALMMSLSVAVVSATVPKEKAGSAMGLLGTMSAIGTTLGPSAGGLLTTSIDWRVIFLVNVPIGIANLALAYRYLPRDEENTARPSRAFDAAGTMLLAVTLGAYALATTAGERLGAMSPGWLVAAATGAAVFVVTQRRSTSPLVNFQLFADASLRTGLLRSVLVSTVMMSTLVVGPFYLSRSLELDALHVGIALSIGPLFAALAGVPAGRLTDRIGTRRATLFGLLAVATGCMTIALVPTTLGVIGYLVPIVITTSGYALFQAANNTWVMHGAGADRRGVVSGILTLSRNLGLITGASAMGAVFAFGAGGTVTTASPDAVAAGMRMTYSVAAALIVIALAIGSRRLTIFAARSDVPAEQLHT